MLKTPSRINPPAYKVAWRTKETDAALGVEADDSERDNQVLYESVGKKRNDNQLVPCPSNSSYKSRPLLRAGFVAPPRNIQI